MAKYLCGSYNYTISMTMVVFVKRVEINFKNKNAQYQILMLFEKTEEISNNKTDPP